MCYFLLHYRRYDPRKQFKKSTDYLHKSPDVQKFSFRKQLYIKETVLKGKNLLEPLSNRKNDLLFVNLILLAKYNNIKGFKGNRTVIHLSGFHIAIGIRKLCFNSIGIKILQEQILFSGSDGNTLG